MTRQKNIAFALVGLLLAGAPLGFAAENTAAKEILIDQPSSLAPSLLTDQFWLDRNGPAGDTLLASEEGITAINSAIREEDPLSADVANSPASLPTAQIRAYIAAAATDALTEELWTSGRPVTEAERAAARRSLTFDALGETIPTRRAVTICRANLRLLPMESAWYEKDDPFQDDCLQGTAVDPGEPVLLLGTNRDGWHFVQMRNYHGWLPADALALADDDDWKLFARPPQFLVVTASRVSVSLPVSPPASTTKQKTPGVPRHLQELPPSVTSGGNCPALANGEPPAAFPQHGRWLGGYPADGAKRAPRPQSCHDPASGRTFSRRVSALYNELPHPASLSLFRRTLRLGWPRRQRGLFLLRSRYLPHRGH